MEDLFFLSLNSTFFLLFWWQYKSRYEGDLVAKCYFAKHKLVWEVLEGGLKSKIEIQWSDIMALKANCPDNGPGTLNVVVCTVFLCYLSMFVAACVPVCKFYECLFEC